MTLNFAKGLRLIALLAVALTASVVVTGASAQDSSAPQYDVELVIFRHLASPATPEDWALEETIANRSSRRNTDDESGAIAERSTSSAAAIDIQPLKPEELKLTSIATSLRSSRNYRVFSHLGWTQAAMPLRSGSTTSLASLLETASPVSGSAKLSRGTNLHLTLDLRLKDPNDAQAYVLQETRQIKLGEKHYFDHPYFGVIATVNARK